MMSSIPPPHFSARDEEAERIAATASEVADAESDLRGLATTFASLGLAADGPVAAGLSELDSELAAIPDRSKSVLLEAGRRCPELVDAGHRSAFLLREEFDPKLAARRLVNYWEYKYELFGPERCFHPITLPLLRDDMASLSAGLLRLLPTKDDAGRAILILDPSRHDRSRYSRESMLRSMWYILQVACEDPDVRELGLVLLMSPRNARFSQADHGLSLCFFSLEASVLPLRFRSIHLCHPPMCFHLLNPVLKFIIGKNMRLRLKVHWGSEEEVLRSLSHFGLPRDRLPSELGGGIVLDQWGWVSERLAKEGYLLPERRDQERLDAPLGGVWSDRSGTDSQPSAVLGGLNGFMAVAGCGAIESAQTGFAVPSVKDPCLRAVTDCPTPDTHSACQSEGELLQIQAERERAARRMKNRSRMQQENAAVAKSPTDKIATHDESSTRVKHRNDEGNMQKLPIKMLGVGATLQQKSLPLSAIWADPRMNKAVVAKLENPKLSHLDALIIGGFSYSKRNESGLPDRKIFDSENVSLSQRKNQLSRRLRNTKKTKGGHA